MSLLVVKMLLIEEEEQGYYRIQLWRYIDPLVRDKGDHESAWKSNPPAQLVTAPTRFEDEDSHRATSALEGDCRWE